MPEPHYPWQRISRLHAFPVRPGRVQNWRASFPTAPDATELLGPLWDH